MSETEPEKQIPHQMKVPIRWNVPDTIQSQYASNAFIQAGEYELSLLFFETLLPIIDGSPEEVVAQINRLDAVQARCVAKIVINPELVPKLIQALQTGLDKYLTNKKAQEGEDNT